MRDAIAAGAMPDPDAGALHVTHGVLHMLKYIHADMALAVILFASALVGTCVSAPPATEFFVDAINGDDGANGRSTAAAFASRCGDARGGGERSCGERDGNTRDGGARGGVAGTPIVHWQDIGAGCG